MKAPGKDLHPADMTQLLRDGVLAMRADGLGLPDAIDVFGFMMELGYPSVAASLVVLVDGSVSIYLSDGGGVIGCGLHPDVRQSAEKLMQTAQTARIHCQPTDQFPAPCDGRVVFYLLSRQGVLTAEAARDELDEGALELSELYYAGHGVIGLVELLGAGVDLVDEMRLAKAQMNAIDASSDVAVEHITQQETRSRGRACRILPNVGNVAHRSHH